MSNRLKDIQSNLEKINSRIAEACSSSKRNISEITLIAVTKTYPASDVDLLKQLGIENVGENKDQEASGKISQVKEKFSYFFSEN